MFPSTSAMQQGQLEISQLPKIMFAASAAAQAAVQVPPAPAAPIIPEQRPLDISQTPVAHLVSALPPTPQSLPRTSNSTPMELVELLDDDTNSSVNGEYDDIEMMPCSSKSLPVPKVSYEEQLAALHEELQMIDDETHPELLRQYAIMDARQKRLRELADIEDEINEIEINRIRGVMAEKQREAAEESDRRVAEIVEQMLMEYDKDMKKVDSFVANLDITRPYVEMPSESSKKALRCVVTPVRKANDSSRALPASVPLSSKIPSFLLKDAEIAEDLIAIGYDGSSSPVKANRIIEVTFAKQKFSYDGKFYKAGEEVFVENREYGRIPAKIDTINDEVVTFKSTYNWDVRQIYASCADFVEGRVVVHKKRNT